MMFFSDDYLSKEAIFIYFVLVAGFSSLLLPKKFPMKLTILMLLWGFSVDTIYDFSIGGHKLDFYDTFHNPRYTLIDLLTYIVFLLFPISFFTFMSIFTSVDIGRSFMSSAGLLLRFF
ncbi:hypothetical protein LOK74_18020 [Brevibacillus humidisoli]|uniref:hypothetical protein n=1 Tax=Brevibacillus humidisoli TaxID=2895522 RepID=UPI001E50D294|nr:hypothetical protein [Brevibacillus humidisoli]UFJ39928.1 hypothetical protein LOK74_18020 [Brevibacillus humidisoli]